MLTSLPDKIVTSCILTAESFYRDSDYRLFIIKGKGISLTVYIVHFLKCWSVFANSYCVAEEEVVEGVNELDLSGDWQNRLTL